MIKRFAVLALALLALALASGESLAKSKKLRLGFATWAGAGPFYVAKKQRFFKQEGIKVDLLRIEDLEVRLMALSSRQVDAVVASMDSLARHLSRGGEGFQTLFALDDSRGGDGLVAHRDIESFADLRGRRVAFASGSVSQFYINVLLQQAGLTESDIVAVDLDPEAAGRAFLQGRVDAAVTWEPWLSQGGQADHGHVLSDSSRTPGLITNVVITRRSVLEERGEDLKALYRAWGRAVEFSREKPEAAHKIMAKGLGGWLASPSTLAGVVRGLVFYDTAMNLEYLGTAQRPGALVSNMDQALRIWSSTEGRKVRAKAGELVSHQIVQ